MHVVDPPVEEFYCLHLQFGEGLGFLAYAPEVGTFQFSSIVAMFPGYRNTAWNLVAFRLGVSAVSPRSWSAVKRSWARKPVPAEVPPLSHTEVYTR
jgi:hypothetical protein